jgi:hypothetical protein
MALPLEDLMAASEAILHSSAGRHLEGKILALPENPGDLVPIPFVIRAGKHSVGCPACKAETRFSVTKESGEWRIRASSA